MVFRGAPRLRWASIGTTCRASMGGSFHQRCLVRARRRRRCPSACPPRRHTLQRTRPRVSCGSITRPAHLPTAGCCQPPPRPPLPSAALSAALYPPPSAFRPPPSTALYPPPSALYRPLPSCACDLVPLILGSRERAGRRLCGTGHGWCAARMDVYAVYGCICGRATCPRRSPPCLCGWQHRSDGGPRPCNVLQGSA